MAVVLALAVPLIAAAAAPAQADYGPGAEPASANGTLLGENTSQSPSISDDGRYVVFATNSVNLLGRPADPDETYAAGLVRRDLVTGAVELVAPPQRVRRSDRSTLSAGATTGASISGNGRYVLFETTIDLTSAGGDLNASSDVYVRDMSRPFADPGAYELASALDEMQKAPDYAVIANGSRVGPLGFGLSDDGRRAVFFTRGASNLPAGGPPSTPRAQVFVRLLDSDRTVLVTRDRSDAGMPGKPVAPAAVPEPSPGPALSGDGSTVAWVDTNPAPQTRRVAGEPPDVPAILWRDITAGPGATTRRVAGTSDPDDPGCPAGSAYPDPRDSRATHPCFGPFVVSEAQSGDRLDVGALGISDDGRRVLFLSGSEERPSDQRNETMAYLADMASGLTRKQGVRRVLRQPGGTPFEVALSGGGARLAFTATGSVFEGPRAIGSFPAGGASSRNTFVVDLAQGIVQRATIGADGTDYRGVVLDPVDATPIDPQPAGLALSDDAGAIAFSAGDGNLFVGDANGASDVQVVRGTPGTTIPGSAFTAPAAAPVTALGGELARALQPLAPVHPVIGYLTVDRRGVARLTVRVPAAGRVEATGSTPARSRRLRLRGRRLRVSRTIRKPKGAATVHLRLAPTLTARKAARSAGRLRVRINVRYKPLSGRSTSAVRSYILTRSAAR